MQHITRYIHLNPKDYKAWPYSSYKDYLDTGNGRWIAKQEILNLFDNTEQYKVFVDDYVALCDELADLKYELADHGITYYNT